MHRLFVPELFEKATQRPPKPSMSATGGKQQNAATNRAALLQHCCSNAAEAGQSDWFAQALYELIIRYFKYLSEVS